MVVAQVKDDGGFSPRSPSPRPSIDVPSELNVEATLPFGLTDTKDILKKVGSAVAEVRAATEPIQKLLGVTLAVANHMNTTITSRPAVGLKLKNLVEIGTIKPQGEKKRSVMEYVAGVFQQMCQAEPVSE